MRQFCASFTPCFACLAKERSPVATNLLSIEISQLTSNMMRGKTCFARMPDLEAMNSWLNVLYSANARYSMMCIIWRCLIYWGLRCLQARSISWLDKFSNKITAWCVRCVIVWKDRHEIREVCGMFFSIWGHKGCQCLDRGAWGDKWKRQRKRKRRKKGKERERKKDTCFSDIHRCNLSLTYETCFEFSGLRFEREKTNVSRRKAQFISWDCDLLWLLRPEIWYSSLMIRIWNFSSRALAIRNFSSRGLAINFCTLRNSVHRIITSFSQ